MPEVLLDFPDVLVLPDEYNKCIAGMSWDCSRVVYDVEKMIDVIMAQSKGSEYELDENEAFEHFTFNIECAFPPDQGPYFIHKLLPTQVTNANKEKKKSNHSGQSAGPDNT